MAAKYTSIIPSTLSNPAPLVNPPISTKPSTMKVLTTQPLLGIDVLSKPITSERLIIRTFVLSDFIDYHSLKSQPEPAALGYFGGTNPSANLNSSLTSFARTLTPWRSDLFYGIFLKRPDGQEDNFIGQLNIAGNNWPTISYRLKIEFWGKGYATEALKAFTHFWWNLPRVQTSHYGVDPDEVVKNTQIPLSHPPEALEILKASIEPFNIASKNVLEKAGFEEYGFEKYGENTKNILEPIKYRLPRPQSSVQSIREEFKEGGKIRNNP